MKLDRLDPCVGGAQANAARGGASRRVPLDPKTIRHARGPGGEDFRHVPVRASVGTTDPGLRISEVVAGREVTPYSDGSEEIDRFIRLTFTLRGTATGRGLAGSSSKMIFELEDKRVTVNLGEKRLSADRVAERLIDAIREQTGWLVQHNGANASYKDPDGANPTIQRMTIYTQRMGRDA